MEIRVSEDLDYSEFGLVVRFCREGLQLADSGQYEEAVANYFAAWELLAEPREGKDTAAWILSAIGDVLYRCRGFTLALDCFERAVRCPGGVHNPFVQMRLGQIYLHLGQHGRAREALALALQSGGSAVFRREDPRWLEWLKNPKDSAEVTTA